MIMITTEAVRNYLNGWGFLPSDFLISEHDGKVVIVGDSSDALCGAAHYLRFSSMIDVDDRFPDRITVTAR